MFKEADVALKLGLFNGECTQEEVDRVGTIIGNNLNQVGTVIGIGGGKVLDTVRLAAYRKKTALVLVPTSVATNAAASGLSVLYDRNHKEEASVFCRKADVVLVDTEDVISAPPRMLVAGIGDALSAYFEARNIWHTNNINSVMPGYLPTVCGRKMVKACLDTLLLHGRQAYLSAKSGLRTDAFEEVVEAIVLLSGVGWENNGCSVAHGLAAAMTCIPDTVNQMHGECVAFSVLVQLILDREKWTRFEQIYQFCHDLNLPVKLSDLGITQNVFEKVEYIARHALETQKILQIVNYELNIEKLKNAIFFLDAYTL